MTPTDRQAMYRSLLEGRGLDLLIEVGKLSFLRVAEICVNAKLIRQPERSDRDAVEDLSDLIALLRTKFSTPRGEKVAFANLAAEFRGVRRKSADALRVRRTTAELRPVLDLIRIHRNRQQHSSAPPQPAHVLSLAGTIVHLLAIGRDVGVECPTGIKDYVNHVADVIQSLSGAESTDPPRLEELRKKLEEAETERDHFRKSHHQMATRLVELKSENERLQTVVSQQSASASAQEFLRLVERQQKDTLNEIRSSLASVSDKVSARIDLAVKENLETMAADLKKLLSSDDGRQTPDVVWMETEQEEESGSVLQIENELRRLRDTIRAENDDLEPWENICMMRPIVQEGLEFALGGRLKTVDDWKGLPSVKSKFDNSERKEKMERQLKSYGEDMMRLYRLVEPSGESAPKAGPAGALDESDDIPF